MTELSGARLYVIEPSLLDEPPPVTPVEAAPSGFIGTPPAPDAIHAPGSDTAGHRCEARVYADCRVCRQRVVYCSVSTAEMRRIRSGAYRCPDCREGGRAHA